jgi:hypothetical protein
MTDLRDVFTPNEAMQHICPQTFATTPVERRDGTVIREAGPECCIAQGCMAWRWAPTSGEAIGGYCGLAGEPHETRAKETER